MYELLNITDEGKSEKFIHKLAEIQALNSKRLKELAVSESDYGKRAKDILSVLESEEISGTDAEAFPTVYKKLRKKNIDRKLIHPLEYKKNDTIAVNKWLVKIGKSDYSQLKSFAKQIKSEDYPEQTKLVRDIAKVFAIDKIEFYVAEGEMSNRIVGYEGSPPFLIFGKNFINKTSAEIAFATAREFAHIYFNHTSVTSHAAWLTMTEKAYSVPDSFLEKVSLDGLSDSALTEVRLIEQMTHALEATNNDGSTHDIMEAILQIKSFMNMEVEIDANLKEKNKLFMASRLLQATADRAGILFAPDLRVAVQSVISSYTYSNDESGKPVGLPEILKTKNNDGTYKYPEIAVRLLNMFSFYLSEEYDDLHSDLMK